MKVALLADVHANLPALEAVLAHAGLLGAEEIWNVGDFVGYGPFPDEVVSRLQAAGAISIQGNYDAKVLKVRRKADQWLKTKKPEKVQAFIWAYENLSKPSREYLRSLPESLHLQRLGCEVLLVHGSPVDTQEHLSPQTPLQHFYELSRPANADLVVFGHSHIPFVRRSGPTGWVNPGSVGRPDDGDPRASYALLDLDRRYWQVEHYRVAYDVGAVVTALRERDLPKEFAWMFALGRNLDAVQSLPPERTALWPSLDATGRFIDEEVTHATDSDL